MEIAAVFKAVHGAFILGSPVDAKPGGAGPTAAGVRIMGATVNGTMPAATTAAEPLEHPPGVCSRFLGFRVGAGV
jgi:hypothetical protein